MSTVVSQITSLANVYSTVYSDAHQIKHQSSAPLAFVRGIHRGPVNSPHKGPVTRKLLPFDDVITMSITHRPQPHFIHNGSLLQKSDASYCCQPEQAVDWTVEYSAIWNIIILIWHPSNGGDYMMTPTVFTALYFVIVIGPLLLTWININAIMDN